MAKGTIELRSGVWAWHTVEVREGGGGKVDQTYFWFRLHDSEASRMHFRLSGAFPEADESGIALQAKHPRERELRAPDATTWLFYEVSRPPLGLSGGNSVGGPYSVLFHSSDGRRRGTAELPLPDLCLGDATDEELLEIVRAAELGE